MGWTYRFWTAIVFLLDRGMGMAKLELYVWDDCAYCKRAREVLERNGVDLSSPDYIEHDITGNPEARKALQTRLGIKEAAMAPQLFVDDKIVGCCADLLDLERSGEIKRRLGIQS